MADEEASKDNDNSDRDYKERVMQETNSSLDNLHFLAEDSLEYLHERRVPGDSTPQKDIPVSGYPPIIKMTVDEIKRKLINLVAREEEQDETGILYQRPVLLDEVQKIAFVSHTMAAFVTTLDKTIVRRIILKIFNEVKAWMSYIFQFPGSSPYFHRSCSEGLVQIVRLALHSRYPKYMANGYETLYTRPPVIYYFGDLFPDLQQVLCFELGLPSSCVVPIPSSPNSDDFSMDFNCLEKLVLEHSSATKVPLMVLGSADSPIAGNMGDLASIQAFCSTHNLWFHIDGRSLAGLCFFPSNIPLRIADSMTLRLGSWIGVPTLPYITLYKVPDASFSSHVHDLGTNEISNMRFDVIPTWVTIQAYGYDNIIQRIHHCFAMTEYLINKLSAHPEIIIHLQGKKAGISKSFNSSCDNSRLTSEALFSTLTDVMFQYVPQFSNAGNENDNHPDERNPVYYDNLNSWLMSLLARNVPSVKTEICTSIDGTVCLRICFLESAHVMHTKKCDIDCFYDCLKHQLGILNATVKQRDLLYKNYSDLRKLKLVQISEWAGMGGARYIPEMWADRLNELTDTGKEDINSLNSDLVAKLKVSDSAFSVGEADDGMLCVRFGMVDEDLNMEELINLVISTGQEIEDSSKYLETLAEMVKHGIDVANQGLIQENQDKIKQEGILKQVPVISSLVSWWFPSQTEAGVKGRSFNLTSGTIESTENIYKYHMQVKEGGPNTPPPASKLVITPSSSSVAIPPKTSSTEENES